MIISLYLNNKILNFKLPTMISGSYTFDYEKNEGSLINIDGTSGKWILYQTNDVKIIENNQYVEKIELASNRFYVVERDNKRYLLYVYDVLKTNMIALGYNEKTRLVISNKQDANLRYDCSYLEQKTIQINFSKGIIVTNPEKVNLYKNKFNVSQENFQVQIGDTLEIYGLRITFLPQMILINNLNDKININMASAVLTNYDFTNYEEPQDLEVKNLNLYNEDDYFSKSPRLRRVIKTKNIKLTAPPRDEDKNQLPLILTIGPMLTMAITSITMLSNNIIKITNNETTLEKSWPQLVTSGVMLISMLVWPLVTRWYNERMKKKRKEEIHKKYNKYLEEKRKELEEESKQQKVILYENLITIEDCLEILKRKNINFWDKRIDQNDFLTVRIGNGNELLDAKIDYPDEDFTIDENDLREAADKLVADYKYICNVPIGYSFYEKVMTNIMGKDNMTIDFINNILLQLITFYSYDDLKIALFTNEAREKNWEYIKYLNHNFSDNKELRFFSTSLNDSKVLGDFFAYEVNNRINIEQDEYKPHYLIIVDGYDSVKQLEFIDQIAECEKNIGFSVIILENRLSKLPSKCNNFIIVDPSNSNLLCNSYEEQEQVKFNPEIHYNIDMMAIARDLANIPVEFKNSFSQLPEAITFMEMENVGKVEQLNILNRWNMNDSTRSLAAEVGVDANGDLMYLDLHEKFHGPHGLIAGMTGSGKSEFIITYILSMAINYSPDDVSFILIDYKGGGLAGAFENKNLGIELPHLAGTITNLDKAEINRTLVSIDSEVKRRQQMFNEARDKLGESTIDIYKYQKFYKEGRITEPISHLFIICDEFAELKSQQPDFMDNLISVARIGRSLGVHLILATQKPSGVVNDQIWSNTKFRVCLKVQDESDSKEMLKRPEAASLKQTGRFYLQVGFDEYFALGQSGWCGAKYYPSDKIIKHVDKSINFINNYGGYIKSIQASNNIKIEAQGEQLAAILNSIIDVSNKINKKAKKLWLENIKPVITEEQLIKKYKYTYNENELEVILGEYDAPEMQEQGLVKYNYIEDGNTLVYGNNSSEIEMMLNSLVYTTTKSYNPDDINIYAIDYGSETFRKYVPLPHVGGVVFAGEDEEYNNLLKMIEQEIKDRKELFVEYGGQYSNYIKNSGKKLPVKLVILNNYDSIYNSHADLYDRLPEIIRDSERYGVIFWITGSGITSIHSKITQSCKNIYAFKLKDVSDYSSLFGKRLNNPPADIDGRGVLKHDVIHNFQVLSITEDINNLDDYLINYIKERKNSAEYSANKIPVLPSKVRLDNVRHELKSLASIPVGISKKELEVCKIDYTTSIGNIISSNRLANTKVFSESLLTTFSYFKGMFAVIIDSTSMLENMNTKFRNYFTDNFDDVVDSIINIVKKYKEDNANVPGIIYIQGFSKFMNKLEDKNKFNELINTLKSYEKISIIMVEASNQIKSYIYESWFTQNFNTSDGVWVGKGISDQSAFKLSGVNKEMTLDYKNDMGFVINEGTAVLTKLIDFVSADE